MSKNQNFVRVALASLLALATSLCGQAETYEAPRFDGAAANRTSYDVVVVGGTSSGIGAAVAARRRGAKVLLLTARPALADDLTGKLRLELPSAGKAEDPFLKRLAGARRAPFVSYGDFTPLQLKRFADETLMDEDVPFRLFAPVTEILRDAEGRIAGVRVANRGGSEVIRAKCVVDATERAVLARRAGAAFAPFSGGDVRFERRVIAGEAPSAPKLFVRELPSVNTVTKIAGLSHFPATGSITGRFFSCACRLEMKDLSGRSLAAAEQRLRDLTWVASTLDAADTLRFFPPDRLEKSVPGVYVAGLVGEADEKVARRRYDNLYADVAAAVRVGKSAGAFALKAAQPGDPVGGAALVELGTCDVFVAGAGTGGGPAAVTAAREGAKTIVVDYLFRMGGLGTEGLIGSYCFGYRGGFTAELDEGVRAQGRVYPQAKGEWLRKETCKAGGEVWFGAAVTGVRTENGRLAAAEVVLADGTWGLVRARAFIDATGNADLAAAAGEETEFIRSDELSLQGAGSAAKVLGACYRNNDWNFVDDTDTRDLAYFTFRARQSMPLWIWDQAQMVNSRERRRLKGAFSVSVQDAMLGRTYPDIVSITQSNFDTHGQTFDNQFFIEDPGRKATRVNLPYRCLLPKKLEGLLVIGLGMSAHRDAMPILRMQPDVQNQGYVAGLAAALALRQGVTVRNVDMADLQRRLVAKDVLPAELAGLKDNFPFPDAKLDEAVASLPDGYRGLPVLLTDAARAVPRLQAALVKARQDGMRDAALAYAHVLGLLGDASGADELAAAVDALDAWDVGWNYRGMDQFGRSVSLLDSYLIALGRTHSQKAAPAIRRKAALLKPTSCYSHYRAVALAFEAAGDRSAADDLARLLALPDVGGHALRAEGVVPAVPGYERFTRHNTGMADRERSDCLRELCVARALYRLGDTPDRLGERTLTAYAADPRRAYANHAHRVLGR